jgi:flagellar motor switch/type III secretory pathway protein FliN
MATTVSPPAAQAGQASQAWRISAQQVGQMANGPIGSLPAAQAGQTGATASVTEEASADLSQALIPVSHLQEEEDDEPTFSPLVLALPVEVDVAVPIRDFRVRHLLALAPGQVVESQWVNGSDLPLSARDVQLAWTEFEVVETRLAVRVTRVA